MGKRSLVDQLNQAVEAMLARREAVVPPIDPNLEPLLSIAAELRNLPSQKFKQRLRKELQERRNVMQTSEKSKTEVLQSVTPYLCVNEAGELIDFTKVAFGAKELFRTIGSAGGIHAEVRIGDSKIMIGGGGAWRGTPTPTALHFFVEDTDAIYQRALEAGATSIAEPSDQPYGERVCGVTDPAGNQWYIARSLEGPYVPEGLRNVNLYFHPINASQFIDFLSRAFGSVEVARYAAPDGTVAHAKVRIGDSVIEMGEAHGPYQPMPTTIYLYTDNVDASYVRALQAGGVSVSEPADQPYGDRVAAVSDPFGNTWYIATHIKL
ncbi:VOC family protein [bacterium]|nr:VOC family protein [bacterium]MCI0602319.1 VOC family protein [bacterium]